MKQIPNWLRRRYVVWSVDFGLGLVAGVLAYVVAINRPEVLKNAVGVLLVVAGLGAGFLAVVLTALAILVAFLDENYVALLRESVGLSRTFMPYKVVSIASGLTTGVALGLAFAWTAIGPRGQQIGLGVCAGLIVWAVSGTVQLVRTTAWHGQMRSRIPEIREAAKEAWLNRKQSSA